MRPFTLVLQGHDGFSKTIEWKDLPPMLHIPIHRREDGWQPRLSDPSRMIPIFSKRTFQREQRVTDMVWLYKELV